MTTAAAYFARTIRAVPRCAALAALFLTSLGATCSNSVIVPPAAQDAAPNITIADVVRLNSGRTDGSGTVTTTTFVHTTPGTGLTLLAGARNAGGVRSFSIVVTQQGRTLYSVQVNGTPAADGTVPNELSIQGSNGAGGIGPEALNVTVNSPVAVQATAENFNGMRDSITATYVPLGPITASLTLTPSSITIPGAANIAWQTTNATMVTIDPPLVQSPNPVPNAGAASVGPTRSTTYRLSAENPFQAPGTAVTRLATLNAYRREMGFVSLTEQIPFAGIIWYIGTLPPVGSVNGQLISITNNNPFTVVLPKVAQGAGSQDCNNPSRTVVLASGASTTPDDLNAIYASRMPSLPVNIVACYAGSPPAPQQLLLGVAYTARVS